MAKEKWSIFKAFKKNKKNNDIILFPNPKDVFADAEMEMYFTPLVTYNYKSNGKEYKIHVLTSAGLICENSYLNSENRFFGFQYVDGKYKFLGNINTFGNSDIKEVYYFLREDFEKNRDYYLNQKVPVTDYIKMIKPLMKKAGHFGETQSLCTYAENFYSHEISKYNYEKTGKLKHLFEITEALYPQKTPYFYNAEEAHEILQNFYSNLGEYFKNRYDFKNAKPVCVVDTFKFSNFSSSAIVFLKAEDNLVYIAEYNRNR